MIIDAHSHLWLRQDTVVDGQAIKTTTRGRSLFFGEEVQMIPPFLYDGRNSAEAFIANMDYAQVNAAVVVQEFIDGLQNEYLVQVASLWPERFKVCAMADWRQPGFNSQASSLMESDAYAGMAIPGHRLRTRLDSPEFLQVFSRMESKGMFLSLCLHEDNHQIPEVEHIIAEHPSLKIAIGHFGMVTNSGWKEQIKLARHKNVMVESGGITWLFHKEFYPYPNAIQAIRQAADLVGMEKLMWGSDYPRTITAITYRMSYDFIAESPLLSDGEKKAFLGENARKFYGFGHFEEIPHIKNMSE